MSDPPKDGVIADFWKMVIQSDVNLIGMVANISPEEACQYWPNIGDIYINFEDMITVETISESKPYGNAAGVVHRVFTVGFDGSYRTINHFQYVNWPDYGVPQNIQNFLFFLDGISGFDDGEKPTIIHCSAGVGRSGTAVAMATIRALLEKTIEVDPLEIVIELRKQRCGMVSTPEQFLLLCDFLTCIYAVAYNK